MGGGGIWSCPQHIDGGLCWSRSAAQVGSLLFSAAESIFHAEGGGESGKVQEPQPRAEEVKEVKEVQEVQRGSANTLVLTRLVYGPLPCKEPPVRGGLVV